MRLLDTIVAPITGAPPAAVAVLRLSGPDSVTIAQAVFHPWPSDAQPRFALYGSFVNGDDGLAVPFAERASFTGESTVELHTHGSRASVDALLEACIRAGARMAEPGEFSQRAFMNGRIDLTQAEGIRDAIEAETALQLRQASLHRSGAFRAAIEALRDALFELLATVEAHTDFGEELGPLDREALAQRVQALTTDIAQMRADARLGALIRHGVRIALLGQPNAGKSSLLNRLLNQERAIVHAEAGTTRDYIEEAIEVNGVKCVVIDTAGLRAAPGAVERAGVERSWERAAAADWVWYLYDAQVGFDALDRSHLERLDVPFLLIANKSDLAGTTEPDAIAISCLTGTGLDVLKGRTLDFVGSSIATHRPLPQTRHAPYLETAESSCLAIQEALQADLPDDLLSTLLRQAIEALGSITGDTASEDMVDRIFRDFCIGK